MCYRTGQLIKAVFVVVFLTRVALAAEPGLVAHYTFDEGSGAVVGDSSGNGQDGRLEGATHVPSPRGFAMRFDGVDDVVRYGSSDSMAVEGDSTLAVWVKTNAAHAPTTHRLIFGGSCGTINRNGNLRIDYGNQLLYEWGDGVSNYQNFSTSSEFLDGTWRHLAVVCDPDAGLVTLYVDAVPRAQEKLKVPVTCTKSGQRLSGKWGRYGAFKGEIDDIRLYDRALSDREIMELFTAAGGVLPDLAQSTAKVRFSEPHPLAAGTGDEARLSIGSLGMVLDPFATAGPHGRISASIVNRTDADHRVEASLYMMTGTKGALGRQTIVLPAHREIFVSTPPMPMERLLGNGSTLYAAKTSAIQRRLVVSVPESEKIRARVIPFSSTVYCEPLRVEVRDPWTSRHDKTRNKAVEVKIRAAVVPNALGQGRLVVTLTCRHDPAVRVERVIERPEKVTHVRIKTDDLPWGAYGVEARLEDTAEENLVSALAVAKVMPDGPYHVEVLNNLVSELANTRKRGHAPAGEILFMNPRDGWCFFSLRGKGSLHLNDDAKPVATAATEAGPAEAMRRLPAGRHRLKVTGSAEEVVVRSIPAMVYNVHEATPMIRPFGPHTWQRVSKLMLPQCNIIEGHSEYLEPMREVKRAGKLWVSHAQTPRLMERRQQAVSVEEATAAWRGSMGYDYPLASGIQADEFISGYSAKSYKAFAQSVALLSQDNAFSGRVFIPFVVRTYDLPGGMLFMKSVLNAGWPFSIERYVPEGATEAESRKNIEAGLVKRCGAWEQALPGSLRHAIVTLMYAVMPYCTTNTCPTANFKVHLDLQMQTLATHPQFFGLYGVQPYRSNYVDEETMFWMGKLLRHYCLEGKTALLSKDPYELTHIQNPDFERGLEGWSVEAAEKGSVRTAKAPQFGSTQGRYPRSSRGDSVLIMKRNKRKPNVVKQTIGGLVPGRAYSVKMISADYRDFVKRVSRKKSMELAMRIDGAQSLPGAFQYVFQSARAPAPLTRKRPFWMTYHWLTFRATGPTATLAITGKQTSDTPDAPPDQEIMVNFLEVQPFMKP